MIALIRYRSGGAIHTEAVTLPGTFGATGTLAVDDGVLEIGTTGDDEVLAVIVYPGTLTQEEIDRVSAIDP